MLNLIETHIYANSIHSIEFMSTVAFRKPFTIPYDDMVEGPGDGQVKFFDGVEQSPGAGKTKASYITLHVRPSSETAYNLINVEPCPTLFDAGAVHAHIEFATIELINPTCRAIILSQGVLVRTARRAEDYEFTFLFSDAFENY